MPPLLLGLSLGLSAGFSPGPLMMLVISTTLRAGFWLGLRVAVAPFLTDVPIILLTVFVLERLPAWTLGAIGIIGGVYVVFLGWETIRSARDVNLAEMATSATAVEDVGRAAETGPPVEGGTKTMARGAMVNALSPHPWLFWATVGGPTLIAAYNQAPINAVAFLAGFYATLIGSKVVVAALIHSQSHRLNTTWYRRILVVLGLLLIGLGLLLVWQGLRG